MGSTQVLPGWLMPDAVDPAASAGFLVAAGLVSVGSLATYAIWLARRLKTAMAQQQKQGQPETERPPG